jgi:UDP-N-acetyl-D-mannosaminuronate dehydrogenase
MGDVIASSLAESVHGLAARSKPFGFMPLFPGAGPGGHGIPIDPVDLMWKACTSVFESRLIGVARRINARMPGYVLECIADALNDCGKPQCGSRVEILGVSYKRDVADVPESPAPHGMAFWLKRAQGFPIQVPFDTPRKGLCCHHGRPLSGRLPGDSSRSASDS